MTARGLAEPMAHLDLWIKIRDVQALEPYKVLFGSRNPLFLENPDWARNSSLVTNHQELSR